MSADRTTIRKVTPYSILLPRVPRRHGLLVPHRAAAVWCGGPFLPFSCRYNLLRPDMNRLDSPCIQCKSQITNHLHHQISLNLFLDSPCYRYSPLPIKQQSLGMVTTTTTQSSKPSRPRPCARLEKEKKRKNALAFAGTVVRVFETR